MFHSKKTEDQILKVFLFVSIFLHVVFFVFKSYTFFDQYQWQEDIIEVELIAFETDSLEFAGNKDLTVSEKTLPQLPKHYRIKGNKKDSISDVGIEPSPTPKAHKRIINDEKIIELTKKEAIARLLRERARKNKKKSKKPTIQLSNRLKKRKKQLLSSISQVSLQGRSIEGGYAAILKSWVKKHYSIPDIFDYSSIKKKAKIKVLLDDKGAIIKIILMQSSDNKNFDHLALRTVRDSEPFPKPPREWVGKDIVFPFDVNYQ